MNKRHERRQGNDRPAWAVRKGAAKVVTDLAMVEKLCAEPLQVEVLVRGTAMVFVGRRLTPAETRQVELWLEKAMPPLVPASAPGEEPRYNLESQEYRKALGDDKRTARALAVWMAYPVFRERAVKASAKLPEGAAEIQKFIEGLQIEDDVLDVLFRGVTERVSGVDFFSDGSSPTS